MNIIKTAPHATQKQSSSSPITRKSNIERVVIRIMKMAVLLVLCMSQLLGFVAAQNTVGIIIGVSVGSFVLFMCLSIGIPLCIYGCAAYGLFRASQSPTQTRVVTATAGSYPAQAATTVNPSQPVSYPTQAATYPAQPGGFPTHQYPVAGGYPPPQQQQQQQQQYPAPPVEPTDPTLTATAPPPYSEVAKYPPQQ